MILNNTEYSWLPHSILKGLDLPKIIYEPTHYEYGAYYDTEAKVICIVEHEDELTPSKIAHELQHHIQNTKSRPIKVVSMDVDIPYEKAIRKYFRSSWSEYDALLFEHKYAKNWLNDWWLRELVL